MKRLTGRAGDAVFSDDMAHRYSLRRVIDTGALFGDVLTFPLFLMLNPSTADHEASDPTVTRCAGFARRLGYGEFRVCNLFSLRATKPVAIREEGSEGDPLNLLTTLETAAEAEIVICAWGTLGELRQRRLHVIRALREAGFGGKLRCLGRTKDGSPRHPLYLPSDAPLEGYLGLDIAGLIGGA